MTIAKGLGGGYQPIGAVLAQKKIVDAMSAGTRLLPARPHLSRPSGRLRGGARGAAGDRARRPARACPRARRDRFGRALAARFGDHPHVGDIRGRGLFFGRRARSRPRDEGAVRPRAAAARARQARRHGARAHDVSDGRHRSTGARGDHVLLAPPFIVRGRAPRPHRRPALAKPSTRRSQRHNLSARPKQPRRKTP